MPRILTFETRENATIRDGMLRVIRNGYIARGIPNPNVTPGSDEFVRAQAIANELEVVEANGLLASDDVMPDSAEDEALLRQARLHGFELQPAGGSAGFGILASSAPTTILTGTELLDGSGLRFKLAVGGTFSNGDALALEAIDVGKATNHDAGDVLRWAKHVPFADEKVIVGTGGLTDGHDEESIESLRQRYLAHLRTPPRSGNWSHVAENAEKSSKAVQKAFVYPAPQGGATLHVAVTAEPTETIKDRDVDATTMNTVVKPTVVGQNLEHAHVVVTTVENVTTEIAIQLTIPEPPTASPPGPGGGWLDGADWPAEPTPNDGTRVTVVTSSTQITVDATSAPQTGVSRISWINASDWQVRTARVLAASGTPGARVITLDAPFDGIAVGDMIWPACERAQAYLDTLLEFMRLMGPGEKSDNVYVLQRGYRHPRPETAWPSALDAHMIGALTRAHEEITDAQFLFRSDGTTDLNGAGGRLVPDVPVSIEDAPLQFVPNRIGFYRLT